jgi:DNA-binding SARP family transcriptional activator
VTRPVGVEEVDAGAGAQAVLERAESLVEPRVGLVLLGGFEVRIDGTPVQLAASAQRVVAFVALHDRPVRRVYVAGSLWLDVREERAAASLRSALWRIHRYCGLIETAGELLRLDPGVRVDLREAEALARRGLRADGVDDLEADVSGLARDLLPGWYDDWVLIERERFRQLRLRSLDALCDRLSGAGRFGDALDAGLLSVAGEPLRESAHRAVVRAHLAEGNVSEALRQYRLCEQLLREQLGIAPSEQMRELIRGLDDLETER